jgi:hypothetical protein
MNREVKLTIKENSYKVIFPKVGKLIDIENMKSILSKGMYGSMEASRTIDSQFALDMIDMEAYYSVLVPELIKDLKVKSLRDLEIEDSVELRKIFFDVLLPFIKQWRDIISKSIKEGEEDSNE